MKRTAGSAEAWEFLASAACFPSEMSENVQFFQPAWRLYKKWAEGHVFNGTVAIFLRAKAKLTMWCYNSIDEKISFLKKKNVKLKKKWGKFCTTLFLD